MSLESIPLEILKVIISYNFVNLPILCYINKDISDKLKFALRSILQKKYEINFKSI